MNTDRRKGGFSSLHPSMFICVHLWFNFAFCCACFVAQVFSSVGEQRMKLWGGRFTGEADAEFARFNASFRFDRRLLDADIEGSRAQAEALQAAGILSRDEADRINDGLDRVLERARTDSAY